MGKFVIRGAQFFADLFILSLAYWLAFLLRFEFDPGIGFLKILFFTWPYVVLLKYLLLVTFGVPNFSWRYISLKEAQKIFAAIAIASAVLVVLRLGLVHLGGRSRYVVIPLGILGMDFILAFFGIAGSRVLRRIQAESSERTERSRASSVIDRRTLLIGAGQAGVLVAKEVTQNPGLGIKVVGYVDDDTRKIGTIIQGHKILGDTASLTELARDKKIEQAIITIAAAPGSEIRRIVKLCESISLQVKIIPGLYEILDGKVNLSRIREVTIEDLLGREAVQLDLDAIGEFISGKRVLVTGAGGSIGSELCRQAGRFGPEQLILVEQAENPLFEIHRELSQAWPGLDAVPCIADICDKKRIDKIFSEWKPNVVFHAAAHKHVPMMEQNPGEAVKNNVFGTKIVADAADKYHTEAFVMISTDKAVNPTSIMGTSKRVAEIYIQALSKKSDTTFVAVRFGNVLGSAGSVIPIFKEQIQKGGPVTVTHSEMKRYFMTIPEACQLVMQAATLGHGGEIFVLDMGEPVKIVDLARDLIRLSGFSEDEIPIKITSIRPGEKLFEELSTISEYIAKTRHPKIYIGQIASYSLDKVEAGLEALTNITNATGNAEIRTTLSLLVPEMRKPDSRPEKLGVTPAYKGQTVH